MKDASYDYKRRDPPETKSGISKAPISELELEDKSPPVAPPKPDVEVLVLNPSKPVAVGDKSV